MHRKQGNKHGHAQTAKVLAYTLIWVMPLTPHACRRWCQRLVSRFNHMHVFIEQADYRPLQHAVRT